MQVWIVTEANLGERTKGYEIADCVVAVFATLEAAVEWLWEKSAELSDPDDDPEDVAEVDVSSVDESASLTIGDVCYECRPHEVHATK